MNNWEFIPFVVILLIQFAYQFYKSVKKKQNRQILDTPETQINANINANQSSENFVEQEKEDQESYNPWAKVLNFSETSLKNKLNNLKKQSIFKQIDGGSEVEELTSTNTSSSKINFYDNLYQEIEAKDVDEEQSRETIINELKEVDKQVIQMKKRKKKVEEILEGKALPLKENFIQKTKRERIQMVLKNQNQLKQSIQIKILLDKPIALKEQGTFS